MKQQQNWVMFLKYPYSIAVMACVWLGSAIMIALDHNMPIIAIITINIVVSWVIAWLSFRPSSLK